ncbi:hypothetical protein B0E47_15975 [Rhodanobacter sp. B05]|uniref:hypothetical protein n=1 Tax=Rhodanobacter sp. B05 TaxID=1945859 RepID=UPI000985EBEB|nr:hypothetical protein [Rhodanobacter sp. B05]OOG52764.1 hypothetical protein B0E47_15975 [Rhodanobacter sp. B05]
MTEREQVVNRQLRALDDAHRLGQITRGEYRARRRRALETLHDPSAVVTARKALVPPTATTTPRARTAQRHAADDTSAAGRQALTSLLAMRPAARRGAILAIVLGVFLIVALAYWALRG